MKPDRTVADKQGRSINIHTLPGGWKITPFQRDSIYQEFLREFPKMELDSDRARDWMKRQSTTFHISAHRIRHFISQAIAAKRGQLPKSDRWDWWVGCSLPS